MSEFERRDKSISLRVTPEEMSEIQRLAEACGCGSVSEYIRLAHSSFLKIRNSNESEPADFGEAEKFFDTKLGGIYHGNSLQVLHKILKPRSIDLIVTSPPFGLVRKKSYGNEAAEKYCKWFRPFAEGMKRVLKPNGSLVIDIGGSWEKGKPTRSLYHFELLLMLCKEFGFHLCQEHYYWSPSRLPTPAEWVNIRRVRVKDAVNCIWWLSKTPYPKADNRRVLTPYSKHMERLLKNGYQPNLRPSGHNISSKFKKNNGGAIPPNILAMPNTESNSSYMSYCEKMGLKPHPARFPSTLPEYFRTVPDQSWGFGSRPICGFVCDRSGL